LFWGKGASLQVNNLAGGKTSINGSIVVIAMTVRLRLHQKCNEISRRGGWGI